MTDRDFSAEAAEAVEKMQALLRAPGPIDWPRFAESAERAKRIASDAQKSPGGPATIRIAPSPELEMRRQARKARRER
jgi:hypothetical protein